MYSIETEEKFVALRNEQVSLNDQKGQLVAEIQKIQTDQSALNLKVCRRVSDETFRAVQAQKVMLQKRKTQILAQMAEINAKLQRLSATEMEIRLEEKKRQVSDVAATTMRHVENVDPTQMSLPDLLIACYGVLEKLDKKGLAGVRERALMGKIRPIVDDRAKKENQINRNILQI